MARTGFAASNNLRYAGAIVSTTPFTVSGWATIPTLGAAGIKTLFFLGNSGATGAADSHEIRLLATTDTVDCQTNTAGGASASATSSTGVPSAGVPFHWAGVFAAANDRRAFINGGSKGTNSTNQAPTTLNRTSLGLRDNVSNANPITGGISHVGVWNIALSDADIAALGAGAHPTKVRPDALVACWPIIGVSPEINLLSNTTTMSIVGSLTQTNDLAPRLRKSRRGAWNV